MRRSRFSEQQIAFILHQAEEGVAVEDVCRKADISLQTYYRWRKKYGGLMPSEMKRLKLLEEENARLKKLVADLSLDLRTSYRISIRRACGVVSFDRSTYHYRHRRPEQATKMGPGSNALRHSIFDWREVGAHVIRHPLESVATLIARCDRAS